MGGAKTSLNRGSIKVSAPPRHNLVSKSKVYATVWYQPHHVLTQVSPCSSKYFEDAENIKNPGNIPAIMWKKGEEFYTGVLDVAVLGYQWGKKGPNLRSVGEACCRNFHVNRAR